MSNSPMVVYTKLSPNFGSRNGRKITKITPHHMSGNLSIETCGEVFAPSSRQASSNYGIGSDGRIGLYVDEANRPWTSSSYENDSQAVTIEVANSSLGGDWPVSDKAWKALVDLCVDICKRNGIPKLIWTGGPDGTLTMHKMFAATDCPGPYLERRMPELAREVNAKLGASTSPTITPSNTGNVNKGKKRRRKMECIFRPNGESYLVFYDGTDLHKLSHPDEVTAIKKVYKECYGTDIPMFELGTKKAPWATRFIQAVQRGLAKF